VRWIFSVGQGLQRSTALYNDCGSYCVSDYEQVGLLCGVCEWRFSGCENIKTMMKRMFKQEKELEALSRQEEMENDEEEQVEDVICEEVEVIYNEFEARQYFERLVAEDEKNEYDGINK